MLVSEAEGNHQQNKKVRTLPLQGRGGSGQKGKISQPAYLIGGRV
jgi:hypothetical protein